MYQQYQVQDEYYPNVMNGYELYNEWGEDDSSSDLDFDSKGNTKLTWAGPISTTLYGDHIKRLCEQTSTNLHLLHSSMNNLETLSRPTQHDFKINSMNSESSSGPFCLSSSSMEDSNSADLSYCYLCATLGEHERNHLHSYPKKTSKPVKPRVKYIAPLPRVRKQLTEPSVAITEALYRIVVFVGDKPGASSDAHVYVSILGSRDELPKQRLHRGKGKSNFCFMRGAVEKFYIKGPKLGNLQILSIEHDGFEKRHGIYIEKIEVTDMKTDLTWIFICKNWLSLHHSDYCIRRDLEAVQKQQTMKEYEVSVVTGKKKLGGTNANVYLTLHGTAKKSDKILLNKSKDKRQTFDRGSTEVLHVSLKDIGEIKSIRIEHDGAGLADGWNLERIILKNCEDKREVYYFLYGGWIASDEGEGQLWREIKAKRKLDKILLQGRKIKYEVTVETGNRKFAGTDANVFIQFVGQKGSTKQLRLDDARNNFERGMIETFVVSGIDVGDVKSIIVGHDNSGPGAGWFLENARVKKYFTKLQQSEKLEMLRKLNQGGQLDEEDVSKYVSMGRRRSSVSRQRQDEKTDENKDRNQERRKRKSDIKDIFDREGNILKIPVYEEYYYEGRQWFATNESDGLIQRELTHFDKLIYYEDKK